MERAEAVPLLSASGTDARRSEKVAAEQRPMWCEKKVAQQNQNTHNLSWCAFCCAYSEHFIVSLAQHRWPVHLANAAMAATNRTIKNI